MAWYWGTAAYAPGTVVASVPADVVAHAGAVFLVHRPSETAPVAAGYAARSTRCWVDTCLTVYTR